MSSSPLLPLHTDNLVEDDELIASPVRMFSRQSTDTKRLNPKSLSIIASFFNICCLPSLLLSLISVHYAFKRDLAVDRKISIILVLVSVSISTLSYIFFIVMIYGLLRPL